MIGAGSNQHGSKWYGYVSRGFLGPRDDRSDYMTDDKARAAFHPFSSLEGAQDALKPRDEIAQAQVDARELLEGVDLSALPRKPLHELAQGDIVLHEGLWTRFEEFEVLDQNESIKVKMVPADLQPDAPEWARRIIAHRDEQFYVPISSHGKMRSSTKYTRSEFPPEPRVPGPEHRI